MCNFWKTYRWSTGVTPKMVIREISTHKKTPDPFVVCEPILLNALIPKKRLEWRHQKWMVTWPRPCFTSWQQDKGGKRGAGHDSCSPHRRVRWHWKKQFFERPSGTIQCVNWGVERDRMMCGKMCKGDLYPLEGWWEEIISVRQSEQFKGSFINLATQPDWWDFTEISLVHLAKF